MAARSSAVPDARAPDHVAVELLEVVLVPEEPPELELPDVPEPLEDPELPELLDPELLDPEPLDPELLELPGFAEL